MKYGDEKLWNYNALDCVNTFEIFEAQQKAIDQLGLRESNDFQTSLFYPVLWTMNKGIRVDERLRGEMVDNLQAAEAAAYRWLEEAIGHPLNIKSPKQVSEFFYSEMGQGAYHNRKTGGVTTDDETLEKIATREPLLRPIVDRISLLRSIGVFTGTFLKPLCDPDGRLRCSFNIGGTVTFRFSSSENVWGTGTNLQNISKGDEALGLPNLRRIFIPDPGMTFFDIDLSAADLRVVVWESDCKEMKQMFAAGLDPYTEIAKEYYNDPTISKKDVSNFKLRKGMPIGARVTLRGEKMYEFLDRLVSVSLPRVRDFKGISDKAFDGRGNYTLGVTEQIIFPEIDIDKVNKITGLDITFVTSANTNEEAYELLKELGMPFKNIKKDNN